jgi:drug/metabolite transporter (DMT)-like permease
MEGPLPLIVFAIIGLAAVMHATWNVILKTSSDPLLMSGRAMLGGSIAAAPLAVGAWLVSGQPPIPPEALALGLLSGAIEVVYLVLLSGAYQRGDLSVVYPIARGAAPLLSISAGLLLLGERLGILGVVGVAGLVGGIVVVQRPWRALRGGSQVEPAVIWALATGVAIAAYSTVDRVGARLVAPWLFAAILFPVAGIGLSAYIRLRGGRGATGPEPSWTRSTVAGLLAIGTYLLVLVAFTLAPLSVVAPLRESAIVLVSGWGAFRLGEASGRQDAAARIGAAVLIVAGALLLALGR